MSNSMKPLRSFKEAINYQSGCPLCGAQLHINDRDLATDYGHDYRGGTPRISFFINQREDDTVTVDPETGEVELLLRNRMPAKIPDFNQPPQPIPLPVYNGKLIHALHLNCNSCCQYSFTLQVHLNLTESKLEAIFLDSEQLSIEEDSMVHEINNSYAMERTSYSYFDKEGDSKKLTLPLITLDLSNPKETIARIRKLLVFY